MKLLLLLFSTLLSQQWQPFHIEDLSNHNNTYIDYHQIDNSVNDLTTTYRNTLSHKVIGYLPYWEYESYPQIDTPF